jgi:hypothetical protein
MSVYLIGLYSKEKQMTDSAVDVSHFHQKEAVELLRFFASAAIQDSTMKTHVLQHREIEVHVLQDHVIVTDKDYPKRFIAFIINHLVDQQLALDTVMDLTKHLVATDVLLQTKDELEVVRQIMTDNIERVLMRGDRIDELVAKTTELSSASKLFYRRAKRTNSRCPSCTIL